MLKFLLANRNRKELNSQLGLNDLPTLITESMRVVAGFWQAVAITGSATTEIVVAKPNESILVTDLIVILAKKATNLTIIPRFHDGSNTENWLTFDGATAPFEYSHAFQGGIRGWKDANFQVVTDQNTITLTVMVGYVHISEKATLTYDVWDAER